MGEKKKIVISGYYGFSNTGDEAVLQAIVDGLKDRAEITVLSASPEKTAESYGVESLSRTSAGEIKKAVRECDLFISGGGSLLQDATSLRSLIYYLWIIGLAKRGPCKTMILGQGIGPLRRSMSRRLTARALNGVDSITVRDAGSARILKEIGVKTPVTVTADPTFLIEPCAPDVADRLLAESGISPENDVVAFAFRQWRESPGLADTAAGALKKLAEEIPADFLLVAMQEPGDFDLAEKIRKASGIPERVFVQPGLWNAAGHMGVMKKCGLAVGMRLHSLIFAASVGTPSVGICYDPKVEEFQDSVGQPKISLRESDSVLLAGVSAKAWNEKDMLAKELVDRVQPIKKAAEENIGVAIGLLGSDE